MLGRSEFEQIKGQSHAALIEMDLFLARLIQLPNSAQLSIEILSELSIKEDNIFFSTAYFSKTVEQGNTELLQARLDSERRQQEAEELKKAWHEQTNSLVSTFEKELSDDPNKIAAIELLEQEFTKNQNIVQALKKGLRALFDRVPRSIAENVSIEELIQYSGEELQKPSTSPRKQFLKRFMTFLEEPVEQFGKVADYVSPKYQAPSGWRNSKTVVSAALSGKTKDILEAIRLHSKRVDDARAHHEKSCIELREIISGQQEQVDNFAERVTQCELEFKMGKERILAELKKEQVFAKELEEKIKEAAEKNTLIQEKQELVEKNSREIQVLLLAARGEVDLLWLHENQKKMRALLSESQKEIALIAQHFAEFNALLAEPALRCKANRKIYQGSIWNTLLEDMRKVSAECGLLKQNQEQWPEKIAELEQDQTFRQCINKKICAMDAAQILSPLKPLSEEESRELEEGLTDEQHIENYKKASEKYAKHLEKEIEKEFMPYIKSLQMALQPVQNEAENALRAEGSYPVLSGCLGISELEGFVLENSPLLAALKKVYARQDEQAGELIARVNVVLVKDKQECLQMALEKYRLMSQLTIHLNTTQDAAQKKNAFLAKLKENASQEILGKKRDSEYEAFAKKCGLAVAIILGFTVVLAYATWKVYQRFYGDERTHGLMFFKHIEKEAPEQPLSENNNIQMVSLNKR